MQKEYEDIQSQGAEILAIGPDTPANTKKTIERSKGLGAEIRFPVLADADAKVINTYNIANPFNPKRPRPAVYIIDERGIIRWKVVNSRPSPAKVIGALK